MKLNDLAIKVHRFGPLENISFKLAPMMIFTGMSSLGKSYANYLVYYFLSMVSNGTLRSYIMSEVDKNATQQTVVFSLDEFLKELADHAEGFMRKFLGDDELTCIVEFKSLKRSRTLSFELKKIEVASSAGNEDNDVTIHRTHLPYEYSVNGVEQMQLPSFEYVQFYFEQELIKYILGEHVYRAVILPPGRGAFAGENFSLKSEVASSLNMYNNYFRDYDFGLNARERRRGDDDDDLSGRLLNLTSGGRLVSIEGKQYLQINEEQRISLSAGASSIKDLSPWLFYLKNHWMMPCAFCLEEPEAHQHPSVTVQIADIMAISMHLHPRYSNIFHLTTHSDYLIQRINQLIKLGGIRRKDKAVFLQICKDRGLDQHSYLDAKDIQAYFFSKNEKGKTAVESLSVTDEGIPMKTFFDVVRDLEEREEYIDTAIYRLNKD